MALTRGDKMIIIGAVALAATVVVGLSVLKKARLFSGASDLPPAVVAPAPAPGAAPIQATPVVVPPPPTSRPAPSGAPLAPPPGATPTPAASGQPASPSALPAGSAATASAARPALAGDETLEHMFAEIAKDGPVAAKLPQPKAATPAKEPKSSEGPVEVAPTPPGSTPVVIAEPQPAPAAPASEPEPAPAPSAKPADKSKAKGKPEAKAKPAPSSKPAPKPATPAKPSPAAKIAASATSGEVVRVVAEDKNAEYRLLVQTNRPPEHVQKMFMADPPRMVLDVAGSWHYTGPTAKATGESFIRQIRIGRHADMFRVVLDMAPDALSKLRGTPTVERVPEGVVLRIPK